MSGQQGWVHARIDWCGDLDVLTEAPSRIAGATHLATWPVTEFDATETDCYAVGDQIWIWQPDLGAVRFSLGEPRLSAYQWPGSDPDYFRQVVSRSWLPAVYPLWGRQVLHASALVCPSSGDAVAFTGSTQAGKSTTAYGVARRGVWQLLSDDTIGFSLPDGANRLHPLPNHARLRPESADFYGVPADRPEPLTWPDIEVRLRVVYVLEGHEAGGSSAEFTRLRASEAVRLLLPQAFTLSFELPKYNQQLMRDYLALASTVPVFRLRYRRSFDVADALFRAIQDHVTVEAGVACSAEPSVARNA